MKVQLPLSELNLSAHGRQRMRQRDVSMADLTATLAYGYLVRRPGRGHRLYSDDGPVIVLSDDLSTVVTVLPPAARPSRHRARPSRRSGTSPQSSATPKASRQRRRSSRPTQRPVAGKD